MNDRGLVLFDKLNVELIPNCGYIFCGDALVFHDLQISTCNRFAVTTIQWRIGAFIDKNA